MGLLGAAIGPRDRHGELCAPAVGVFLSCHHPVEPNDPVWNALHEQLELHHPGQCCPDCKRSWHYVSKVDSDAGLASESFSVLLPLDQVHPLMARLVRADLRALFEAASAQALASLELGTTQSGIAAGCGSACSRGGGCAGTCAGTCTGGSWRWSCSPSRATRGRGLRHTSSLRENWP